MDRAKADPDEGGVLITAKDLAKRDGKSSVAQWMLWLAERSRLRGMFSVMWDGMRVSGLPLIAYIDFGRWMVRCDCGQYNYADPDEPFVFCARCGNGNSGSARPVLFPNQSTRDQIESALLARPVIHHPLACNAIEDARLAKPIYELLPRTWYPHQTVDELLTMNTMMKEH